MITIQFNAAATQAIQGRQGGKLRMEVRDGTLFIRPTDRKAGPHVLTELQSGGRGGKSVSVQIDEKQLEKLGANELLEHNAAFNLVEDKYGWYALRSGDDTGDKTVDGGKATVAHRGGKGKNNEDE